MGLPASQRRILERIETALRGSDPRLAALFTTFGWLNRDEDMPRIEQVRLRAERIVGWFRCRLATLARWFGPRRRGRVRAALFFPVALAIVASAVLVVDSFPGESRCALAPRTSEPAHRGAAASGATAKACHELMANMVVGR